MLETSLLSLDATAPAGEFADGPRIVIAEDDPTVRMILAGVLTAEGYQVAEAADGTEALARARENRPDLIILDVEMPGANGFEVCRAIRGASKSEGPPILILTGLERADAVSLAFESGATDFASKPIQPALLLHRVRFLLRNAEAVTQLRRNEQALEQAQRLARLGSWSWHLSSGLASYSRSAHELLDLSSDEGIWFREFLDRVPPEERGVLEAALGVTRRDGSVMDKQHRILLPGGNLRHLHTRAELVRDDAGHPDYIHGTIQELSGSGAA